jgi:hypothetical protein
MSCLKQFSGTFPIASGAIWLVAALQLYMEA